MRSFAVSTLRDGRGALLQMFFNGVDVFLDYTLEDNKAINISTSLSHC